MGLQNCIRKSLHTALSCATHSVGCFFVSRNIQDTFVAPPCHAAIELLYEDDSILIIDKPSGLLALSGKNPLNSDSVHARLVRQWPEALLVHRLDFGTSGLLVIARSKPVVAQLNRQFQERRVRKTYQAVVMGRVSPSRGVIDAPIARDDDNFPKMTISQNGKPARTHYKVIDQTPDGLSTRLELTPITGRTHQLRIHSAHIGHPILGCDIYGSSQSESESSRLLLHATSLTFTHPVTEQTMVFESVCPF